MKPSKARLVISFCFLFAALTGYLHQALILKVIWDWSQFWHHETLIIISIILGIATFLLPKIKTR